MRSNRDEPRGRVRFACFRVAAEFGGPFQPQTVVVRLSPHADAHTARPVAAGRARASGRSAGSIACARRLDASTVRHGVRACRSCRGWAAFRLYRRSGCWTAAASEDTSCCARRAGRAQPSKRRFDRATARPCGSSPSGAAAHGPGTGRADAAAATTRRRGHSARHRADRATARPSDSSPNATAAHGPGTGREGARPATPRRCTRPDLQDQMGLGTRALGVPGDRSSAGRQRFDPRPLAALPLAAAAVARCHASRRRRARNAGAPARRGRMATVRRQPAQLVRKPIPSTRAFAARPGMRTDA
jgi:hypothetical protein